MIDALGPHAASHGANLAKALERIDANRDGSVSRDEFVSGTPEGVSAETAGRLFDTLDSEGAGSLGLADLTQAFQRFDSQLRSALIALQSDGATPPPPPPSEVFSSLDSDGDGILTRDEFINGRPDHATEEQASAIYDKLVDGGEDGLTQEQFAEASKRVGPPPGPPPLGEDAQSQLLALLDANGNGTIDQEEFLSADALLGDALKAVAAYQRPAEEDSGGTTVSA